MSALHWVTFFATKAGIEPLRADAEPGQDLIRGARKGHEAVHGDERTKKERWQSYQDEYDGVLKDHPGIKRTPALRITLQRLKKDGVAVSVRALFKRTEHPE